MLTGAALAAPVCFAGNGSANSMVPHEASSPQNRAIPPMLDHILLGCSDLQQGIDFVAARTGVRAEFSGVHPGRGTQNALLSLGPGSYLEIIAPDPKQESKEPMPNRLKALAQPALVKWAAHPLVSMAQLAGKLKGLGVAFEGPDKGSRRRPDGKMLHWETLALKDDASGILPFFIQWAAGTPHPSFDSPPGCSLQSFYLVTPDVKAVAATCNKIALSVAIEKGARPYLAASISGPGGTLTLP